MQRIPAVRYFLCLALAFAASAPLSAQDSAPDTLLESRVLSFRQVGTNTSQKAIMQVALRDVADPEPIMGATVLLRRDKDKMLGKVSNAQGNCTFYATPATYTLRVQMTGLKSIEKPGFVLEAGKTYQMEVAMRRQ